MADRLCHRCGSPIEAGKHKHDKQGNLYCLPCCDVLVREARQRTASPRTPQSTQAESASTISSQRAADTDGERLTRGERKLIIYGVAAGLLIVGVVVYILFIRDWWEARYQARLLAIEASNQTRFLAMQSEAESLVFSGSIEEAKAKYDGLLSSFGSHVFKDASVQDKLNASRSAAKDVTETVAIIERTRREVAQKKPELLEQRKKIAESVTETRRKLETDPWLQILLANGDVDERMLKSDHTSLVLRLQTMMMADKAPGNQCVRVSKLVSKLAELDSDESSVGAKLSSLEGAVARVITQRAEMAKARVDNGASFLADAKALTEKTATPKDYQTAMQKLQIAADVGNAEAMRRVGFLYSNGLGVREDKSQALHWYDKAALAGDVEAMVLVGVAYQDGRGVKQDHATAVGWYRKAAESGNSTGMAMLGNMYREGLGVTKSSTQAIDWLKKAAEAKAPVSMGILGLMYEGGDGVTADPTVAAKWYRQGAEAGDVESAFRLGNLYLSGRGVAKDYDEARRWYRKAAAKDHGEAAFNVGVIAVKGWGMVADKHEALRWFELAEKLGFERAKEAIQAIQDDERSAQEVKRLTPVMNDLLGWAKACAEFDRCKDAGDSYRRYINTLMARSRMDEVAAAKVEWQRAIAGMEKALSDQNAYDRRLAAYSEADRQQALSMLITSADVLPAVQPYLKKLVK